MNQVSVGLSIVVLTFFTLTEWSPKVSAASPPQGCQTLQQMSFQPPGDAQTLTIDQSTLVPAGNGLPEYCQVNGHVDAEIHFTVNLPTAWNHKLLMSGNSGFAADLQFLDLQSGLVKGYATFGTDGGHSGDASDFLNRPDRIKNFFYRAVHLTTLTAKEIAKAYYNSHASHSYFVGCSEGGTEGMKEAHDYPTDFDGIVAGAPRLPHNGGFRLWNSRALFPTGPSSGVLPYQKLPLLTQIILKKCDTLDGVADGIVDNPSRCHFSPEDLPHCVNNVETPNCFTTSEIAALEKIHHGPKSNGVSLGSRYSFSGVEGYSYGDAFNLGVQIYSFAYNESGFPGVPEIYPDFFDVGMPSFAYWLETNYTRYLVFNDPNYLIQNFNYNNPTDVATYNSHLAPQMPADADLDSFARTGGKLIMWQGWGDSVINPTVTKTYYNRSSEFAGGIRAERNFNRLFLFPGTDHCGGGPGFWNFDPLPVLENWVEKKKAPDFILGNSPDKNANRPVCAYPTEARLINRSADPTQPSNFRCVEPDQD